MASSGSGGVSGPDYGRVRNELHGIATEFLAIGGAINELRTTIRVFRDLEAQLSLTNAVAGGTAETYARLEVSARRFALGASFSANEVASSFYFLASAGFSVQEAMAAANGVLLLAQGNLANISEVSDIVASNIKAFGLEAYETGRITNVMAAAVAKSQATLQKLGFAFRQVGPIAAQAGLSFEQTTASLGVLFDVGLRGEQAGTALRNVITRLQAPTGETAELLEELNIQVFDASGSFRDFYDILGQLADAGLADGDLALIAGTEALAGFNALLSATRASGGDISRIEELTAAITGTNQAYIQSTAILETLDGAIKLASNSFDELRLIVGSQVAPVLTDVLYKFVDAVGGIQQMDRAAQLNTVSMGLWAVGAVALVRQITNLEEFVVRGTNASKAWSDATMRWRLINKDNATVLAATGKSIQDLGGRFGLAARSAAGFGNALSKSLNFLAGPAGAIALLGGLAYAIYQTDQAAKKARFDKEFGSFEPLYDKFARRARLAELQFQYDNETGAGISEYISAQNTILQDLNKELQLNSGEYKELLTVDRTRAEDVSAFIKHFSDVRAAINNVDTLRAGNEAAGLFVLQDLSKKLRQMAEEGANVAQQSDLFDRALNEISHSIENAGGRLVVTNSDGGIVRKLDLYERDIEQIRLAWGRLDDASRGLVLAALASKSNSGYRDIVDALSGENGPLKIYTDGVKLFDKRIKELDEDTARATALIGASNTKITEAIPLLVENVKTLIEIQSQGDYQVEQLLKDYFSDSKRTFDQLRPILDAGEDPLNALLSDVYQHLNSRVDIPALKQGADYVTITPLLRDEFIALDAQIRKSIIDIAIETAKGQPNPDAQTNADLSALREQYEQNARGINEKILETYTTEISKAGSEFSRVDDALEATIKAAYSPLAGATAASADPAEVQLYVDALLEAFIDAKLTATKGVTRADIVAGRDYPKFAGLVRRQAEQISNAYVLAQAEQGNLLREALEAKQERRFNARLDDPRSFEILIGGYQIERMEALRKYLLTPGLAEDTEIRQVEQAFNERNATLRDKYGALFQSKVVYGTRQAFDETLQDAFSGIGVGTLDYNDLANKPQEYITKAMDALEAALPAGVEDRAERIRRAEEFLNMFITEIKFDTQNTADLMAGLFEEKQRQIDLFKVDVANYIGANAAAIAQLQSAIGVSSGGVATDVAGLVANERSLSALAEFDERITDITQTYEEYIRKAQDDEGTQNKLIAQRDDLIKKTEELRDIEVEWQNSSEGRTSALVDAQQRIIDEFVKNNQLTGTILQGVNAEIAQMLLEQPTNFELGQQIVRDGIEGTAQLLSGLIIGIEDDWRSSLSNMLSSLAQFVSQAIIQALLLRAVMAIPGVGGIFQTVGPLTGLGGNAGGFGNAVHSGANPIPFSAKGDAFSNGYMVEDPSLYSFKGGLGMAGEMGTEAIMPLSRGKNGKLGVSVEGGVGGGGTSIKSTLNLYLTVEASQGSKPEDQAKVIGKAVNAALDARDLALMEKLAQRGDVGKGGPF